MAKYSQTFKSGEKRALASYKVADDKVFQITFLLPKEESTEICKKSFITHFTQKQVDGNAVWVNSNTGLIYEAGFQGEIGIIVVK